MDPTPLPSIDEARKKVWFAFAEHFLDTETRHELPMAALAAVEAGFSVDEARRIWREEVTPVVGANLLSVAGEWAGWDEAWLVERIASRIQAQAKRPRWLARLAGGSLPSLNDSSWRAIERLMVKLQEVPPEERRAVTKDLFALARHFFDFVPPDLQLGTPGRREALRQLFVETLLPALRPTVVRLAGESVDAFVARVEMALGG
jgi:hypothetical protein